MLNKNHNPTGFRLLAEIKWQVYMLALLLIITFIVYKGLLSAEFLDYDDNVNIVQNHWIQGFAAENLKAIFTTSFQFSYNPVTFLFYALEYKFFGLNATGFHLVNILLHLVNILLVFRLASLFAKDNTIALAVAALFALHPIHTDVVGWASAQNYLLATLFYLSSLILYIQYIHHSSRKKARAILSLIFFILACLSKSQAVTLAVVILMVNRIYKVKYDTKLILTVSGFFIIAIVTGLLTIYFRSDMGKTEIIPPYSFMDKNCVISFAVIMYIFKMIYPAGLTAIESFPGLSANGNLPVFVYLAPIILTIAGIIVFRFFTSRPLVVFGLLFFFLNILITQVSFLEDGFSANRYFYLSSLGLYLPVAVLGKYLFEKAALYRYGILGGGFILIIILSFKTYARAAEWKNTLALTSGIIEKSPDVAMAYNIRGIWYYNQREYDLSIQDFNRAISLYPDYSPAYYNRGLSLSANQDFHPAMQDYNKAIGLNPVFGSAYLARGVLFLEVEHDFRAALNDFDTAVNLDPSNARAYYNRGLAHLRMRDVEKACIDWQKVKSLGYSQADAMILKYCR